MTVGSPFTQSTRLGWMSNFSSASELPEHPNPVHVNLRSRLLANHNWFDPASSAIKFANDAKRAQKSSYSITTIHLSLWI